MIQPVLAELRKLQYERGYASPFDMHIDFQIWADQVLPRLAFDEKLANKFKHQISIINSQYAFGSSTVGGINEAIGLLTQAILALEQKLYETKTVGEQSIATKPELLHPPEKMTLRWLIDHVPISYYAWFAGALVGMFTLGVAFTETPFYGNARMKATGLGNIVSAPSVQTEASSAGK